MGGDEKLREFESLPKVVHDSWVLYTQAKCSCVVRLREWDLLVMGIMREMLVSDYSWIQDGQFFCQNS